jgi:hypothetical protein
MKVTFQAAKVRVSILVSHSRDSDFCVGKCDDRMDEAAEALAISDSPHDGAVLIVRLVGNCLRVDLTRDTYSVERGLHADQLMACLLS